MNKKYIIIIITALAITLTAALMLKPKIQEAKLDRQELKAEQEIDKINQQNPLPQYLDGVYEGPNEDRPLPESFY